MLARLTAFLIFAIVGAAFGLAAPAFADSHHGHSHHGRHGAMQKPASATSADQTAVHSAHSLARNFETPSASVEVRNSDLVSPPAHLVQGNSPLRENPCGRSECCETGCGHVALSAVFAMDSESGPNTAIALESKADVAGRTPPMFERPPRS